MSKSLPVQDSQKTNPQSITSILAQYKIVFVATGTTAVLVVAGLAYAVVALKADSKLHLALEQSAEVAPMEAPLIRPPVTPDAPLADFRWIPATSAATAPSPSLSRALPAIAKDDPPPFDADALDWLENFEHGQPEAKGIKELLAHLDHQHSQVRLKAIVRLGRMGSAARDAAPLIARNLGNPDKDLRDVAAKALARIGPAAVAVLIQELKNPASQNHARVARGLALIGPGATDAVPALTDCLKHKDGEVRATAALALAEIGPPSWKAATPLTLLLGDPVREVHKQARAALVSIGPGAIPALRGALKSPHGRIRCQAADLLALQAGQAKDATGDLIILLKDTQPAVRRSAALALAAIGRDARAAVDPLLAAAADSDSQVRTAVAVALGELKADGQALTTLVNLFGDRDFEVRLQAAQSVVKIGPSAINVLINTIPNENFNKRLSAIFALGEIGPQAKDAVPLLIEQLNDKLPMIRSQAALALGKIGPKAANNAVEPVKERIQKEPEIPARISMRLSLVQLLPKDMEVAQQLNQDVLTSLIGANQELVKRTLYSFLRPKTPLEIQRNNKIQGVLNFYTFRNSFRFGDGLDDWSHKVLQSLGHEAIPAMVDTLNRDNLLGGRAGFVVKGRQVQANGWEDLIGHPDPGPGNVFFK